MNGAAERQLLAMERDWDWRFGLVGRPNGSSAMDRRQGDRRIHISGKKARQGEIVLRTRTERIIFILGLAGIVVIAVLLYAL